jgi:malate dehydrogenase
MKISFIGAGRLGSIIAYTAALRNIADEIVMVDIVEGLGKAQGDDMYNGMAHYNDTVCRGGEYEDIADSDIILVAAGKPRKPGMTRMDLLDFNVNVMKDVAANVKKYAGDAVLVTLTNPMDAMNYALWRITGFERERVIGSGGQLDTSRLRSALSWHYKVPQSQVEAYVIGEHGETQMPVWSRVKIKGKKVEVSPKEREEIREQVRAMAIGIIGGKGATEFGPANGTADMLEAIATGRERLVPSSIIAQGEYGARDISIGMPAVLGKGGLVRIEEWDLAEDERAGYRKCIEVLEAAKAGVDKVLAV